MPFSADAIANFFLDKAAEEQLGLSPMKLQKLVYFAHGWHFAINGTPLINEQVEAWKFGPVIRSLYHEFKSAGNQAITERAYRHEVLKKDGRLNFRQWVAAVDQEARSPEETSEIVAFLNRIWDVYGRYTGVQLSRLTHLAGSPWDTVCKAWNGDPPKGTDIPQDLIREYFSKLSAESPNVAR
ncbi:MAG: SocA family protein [Planctomycetaceae bacterium]|jgi:uncharacterized phage-associated protein|nr:SocA family protein [Planctomycetaceae bacterium]